MANSKSIIREINLQTSNINLNKNKSIISDFTGFNRNSGVWFNGVLSNLYCKEGGEDGDVITIDNDTYKIVDNSLYKNDVLVKDYSNINKVKTEILGNISDDVIAYTPQVRIYYRGNNVYVTYSNTTVPVGVYYSNTIPYIIIDKEDDTWCVIYGSYVVCKGMTTAIHLSFSPTAAIYSNGKWYCINTTLKQLINVQNTKDTVNLNMSVDIISGAANVSGWTPSFNVVQVNSRSAFAGITNLKVSNTPTVTFNKSKTSFKYLKGFYIEGTTATPRYSHEGNAVNMSVMPSSAEVFTQPYTSWSKLASLKTKFLTYDSYLTMPYSTVAFYGSVSDLGARSSVDGPTTYLLESAYTTDNNEFMTLAGSTIGTAATFTAAEVPKAIGDASYPKLLGLFNSNYSPEWLYTDIFNFKLIYNRDALVGISKDGSIVAPWNDIDENTLTITENDIYYYSLNSRAWIHINVGKENKLEAIKIGKNLLLNSLIDNCYRKEKVFTYSVDTTLASFVISKPRVGLINVCGGAMYTSYIIPSETNNYDYGDLWFPVWLETIKKQETYYISIVDVDDGPIWSATQLLNYAKTATNVRKEGWQYTLNPSFDTQTIDYGYYISNMTFTGSANAYTSNNGSVLSYFKSWYQGLAKYDGKLADTEKSLTEPTYYNLSPNTDIMTFIEGFNTMSLIKVGNSTLQLLVKESELLLVYNLLSNVDNVSDYFVLQGQQYGIINNYINKIDMVNGQVVSQIPITSVEGLKFLGNTDKQAFFFSQMNKTILYFAADNTLEFLMDATEVDSNTTTVFAKQTNDIFLLLNDKVIVFTNGGSMYEILSRAEYITFGDNSWSDGNKTWSYYKISPEQERVPIEIETVWYGDVVNRRMMNVDCVYIELYDDNFMPGTFEISFDGLVNNTVSAKKQVFNVKEKDYDKVTKTVYLRYQPAFQNCAAFKLNIKSDLAIKRLAVGYTTEGIPTISKNNI